MKILKGFERAMLLSIALVMLLFCSGCIEMTMKTRIMADGRCSEAMIITTSAMFAEGIKSELEKKDLSKEGYKVDQQIEGDKVHMSFSRDFKSVADMYSARQIDPVSGIKGEQSSQKPRGDLKIEDLFFIKTMTFREIMPKIDKGQKKAGNGDKQMDEMQHRLAQGMFSFKRVIEMPGPIIASNADSVDKAANIATWSVPFDKLEEGAVFEAKSQIVNVPGIIVSAIVLLGAILGAAVVIISGRKKKLDSPEADHA